MVSKRFHDRREAGRELAAKLSDYHSRDNAVVLALPRGGVPIAFEVARKLEIPLELFFVRKLGVPHQPELAMGAVASGGIHVLYDELIQYLQISPATIAQVTEAEQREIERQAQAFGQGIGKPLTNRIAILVDDGLATGATMLAAVRAVRKQKPERLIVAVPVSSQQAAKELSAVDEFISLLIPSAFFAVGSWYEDFSAVSDAEVRQLLDLAKKWQVTSVAGNPVG